jgi:hypothetical protein
MTWPKPTPEEMMLDRLCEKHESHQYFMGECPKCEDEMEIMNRDIFEHLADREPLLRRPLHWLESEMSREMYQAAIVAAYRLGRVHEAQENLRNKAS